MLVHVRGGHLSPIRIKEELPMAQFYDVIIIGSGPAGLTAALYLGRAGQKCVVLEKDFVGGYTAKIAHIENYPGYETINGMDLTQIMAKQAEKFGATIIYPVEVVDMELKGEVKRVRTREEVYEAHAVIIAIGVARKKLEVPGAKEFLGKGVSYCATCDGNFFKGRKVAVVGSDDEAAEEALHLADLAEKVTMVPHKELDIVISGHETAEVQAERGNPADGEDPCGRRRRTRHRAQDHPMTASRKFCPLKACSSPWVPPRSRSSF